MLAVLFSMIEFIVAAALQEKMPPPTIRERTRSQRAPGRLQLSNELVGHRYLCSPAQVP